MSELIQPHILVIDDDPQIRGLLQEYLAENGLRVSVASTGKEMSEILAEEPIDLIILDLRLAGEDGMTIARTLRDQSAIPIVMLTGIRDEADRVMGLELGADDYLTKPFSPRELLARIRTVLRRQRTPPGSGETSRDSCVSILGLRAQSAHAPTQATRRAEHRFDEWRIQFARRPARCSGADPHA